MAGETVREVITRAAYEAEWEGSLNDIGREIERALAYQIADAILTALSEAGLTVCGERVGTAHKNGGYFGGWTLEASLMNESGRPVFIQSEEPK